MGLLLHLHNVSSIALPCNISLTNQYLIILANGAGASPKAKAGLSVKQAAGINEEKAHVRRKMEI